MFRSITHIKGFSHDDDDDTASYLTMAARGIHECTVDSFFTVNVPRECDQIDFSHSFSEIGSNFDFGLKSDNVKSDKKVVIHRKESPEEVIVPREERDKTCEKVTKLKQKYIVSDNQRFICPGKEHKTNNGKKLKMKWKSV